MLKNNKKSKGFTLVEVIVVAVIVGVLAAVAIPLYLNYVNDSRLQSATNVAGAAAVFCAACKNSGDTATIAGAAITNGKTITNDTLGCPINGSKIAIPEKITITIHMSASSDSITAHHNDYATKESKGYPF